MKKEIKIATLVLIGFLSLLWLEKPLREFLSERCFDVQIAKQISSIAIRTALIGITFWLITKWRLIIFTGLKPWQKFKNIQAIIIALGFIIMGISANWTTYTNTKVELLILFTLSTFAVGIVEEFVFRGTIFPLLIKSFKTNNRPILRSAVLSSFMFGLVHFLNLFRQPENIIGITSQVFFATSIGVFFCGLMVRTENILIPGIIHALVNFSFGAGQLKQSIQEASDLNVQEVPGIHWSSLIPTTLFFSFIFLGGLYMIIKTDKDVILDKLQKE